MKVLVTGGVRSGKSRHAEALLADRPACYVAAGPVPDVETDPDWVARIRAHRARRPVSWTTRESTDLAAEIDTADTAVLIDCLGTWLTAVIDEAQAWESPNDDVLALVESQLVTLIDALERSPHDVVVVTNEVGLGVVPAHRSGRLFRDLLGTVNQRVATACDEVHLVVAGRVLRL